MTTITPTMLAAMRHAAENEPDADSAVRAILALVPGVTIAPPEPPDAMVKLAREIVREAGLEWSALRERAALAALQHAVRAVKDAQSVPGPAGVGDNISREVALAALGAA